MFSYAGGIDLYNYALHYPDQFSLKLITPVEHILVDGKQGVRFIYGNMDSYVKKVFVKGGGRLYDFWLGGFDNTTQCMPQTISDEAVFEFIIQIWKFID
jgi:hypothetical protein